MKTIRVWSSSALLLLLSTHTNALLGETRWKLDSKFSEESGLNGYVQLLAGGYSAKGLSSVEKENQRITVLDDTGDAYEQEFVIAYWELGYQFDQSGTSLFIGTPSNGIDEFTIPLEFGIKHTFPDETIVSASYVPKISGAFSEVWEDPYLTKQNRARTDTELEAFRVSAEYIFGSPFSVMYEYGEQTIENDHIGRSLASRLTHAQLEKLKRDRTLSRARFILTLPLTNSLYIIPEANYTYVDAQGEANSYAATGFGMNVFYQLDPFEIFGGVSQSSAKYRASNPVFHSKRKDSCYSMSAGVSYLAPFGWKSASLDLIVSGESQDSKIQFYDKEEMSVAFGMTYRF
jgi:hypothetical protein